MLFVYGPYMPIRLLEEIRFWKTQEREHTAILRQLTPDLEPEYASLLEAWEPVFAETERRAGLWIDEALPKAGQRSEQLAGQADVLLHASAYQSQSFVDQLLRMMNESAAVANNPQARSFILHAVRESTYYLGMMEAHEQVRRQTDAADRSPYDSRGDAETLEFGTEDGPFRNGGAPEASSAADASGAPQAEAGGEEPRSDAPPEEDGRSPVEQVPIGGHTLPPLPYPYHALEPHIDEQTMRIHHDKHHQSYVDGLNKAEKELQKSRRTGNFDLVKHWERELAFNGAGHYLHTLFWNVMSPHGGGRPSGALAEQLKRDFGSYDAFKKQFSEAAGKVEGGGWAILVWSPRSRRLEILTAEKHQNLSQWDVVPILPLDVWEHAYYLKHQNKRDDYIKDWWNVVNWPYVSERFAEASRLQWKPY